MFQLVSSHFPFTPVSFSLTLCSCAQHIFPSSPSNSFEVFLQFIYLGLNALSSRCPFCIHKHYQLKKNPFHQISQDVKQTKSFYWQNMYLSNIQSRLKYSTTVVLIKNARHFTYVYTFFPLPDLNISNDWNSLWKPKSALDYSGIHCLPKFLFRCYVPLS